MSARAVELLRAAANEDEGNGNEADVCAYEYEYCTCPVGVASLFGSANISAAPRHSNLARHRTSTQQTAHSAQRTEHRRVRAPH